jgi:tRNA (cytidine/uridine-2'-O-)-methyltransferase
VDAHPLLHIVLYEPEIPQNTGNAGRTCVALGARLWLVRPLGFRLDAPQLRRAGLDYWEHLDWQAVDGWSGLLTQFPAHRFWYFTKCGQRPHWEAEYQRGDVLVFGSETRGLPTSMLDSQPERCLRIPMPGPVRSLNLAAAVAVGAYEAFRQIQRE